MSELRAFVIATLFAAVLSFSPLGFCQGPPAMTADQVMDSYLEAIGGQEAWSKVGSIFERGKKLGVEVTWVRAKVEFPSEVPFQLYVKRPGRFLSVIYTPRGQLISACDGAGSMWFDSPQVGFQRESIRADDAISCEGPLVPLPVLWRSRNWKIELKDKKFVHGKEAWLIRVIPGKELPEIHYFDVASRMLVRSEVSSGFGFYQSREYSDFRVVNGLTFPFKTSGRITWTQPLTEHEGSSTIEEIRVNQPLDDDWFNVPKPGHSASAPIPPR